jgi:hypothetical protein
MTRARGGCPGRSGESSALDGLLLGPATGGTRATPLTAAPRATLQGWCRAIAPGRGRRPGHPPRYKPHSQGVRDSVRE